MADLDADDDLGALGLVTVGDYRDWEGITDFGDLGDEGHEEVPSGPAPEYDWRQHEGKYVGWTYNVQASVWERLRRSPL
jgi:hypothetical protein